MKKPQRERLIEALKIAQLVSPTGYCDTQHDILYIVENRLLNDHQRADLEMLGCHLDAETDHWSMFT